MNTKNLLKLLFLPLILLSCESFVADISVTNPTNFDRTDEVTVVPMSEIRSKIKNIDHAKFVLLAQNGEAIPYQITHDDKLLFVTSLSANQSAIYRIDTKSKLTPPTASSKVYGRLVPERKDDVAWENNRIAFRTYGPALEASGEITNGYDIWVKRVPELVINKRYEQELNKETLAEIDRLKAIDPKASQQLRDKTSYHVDHGDGLDYYKVGRTLGAGGSAPFFQDSLWLSNNFTTCEVLDNGPYRFSMKLTYAPYKAGSYMVNETRILNLDADSHLNQVTVTYNQLPENSPVTAGIVLHDTNAYRLDATKGYISYADPIDSINGQIYVGIVFPASFKEAKVAHNHALAIIDYSPQTGFNYYFGAGWSKFGFANLEEWNSYLETFAAKIKAPLEIVVN